MGAFLTEIAIAWVSAMQAAQPALVGYGLGLLALLAIIRWYSEFGLSLAFGQHGDALALAVLLCLKAGVAYYVLTHLAPLADATWQSALVMGAGSAASTPIHTPGVVIELGYALAKPLALEISQFGSWFGRSSWAQLITVTIAYWIVLLSFTVLAWEILLTIVSFYMAVLACTVLIGTVLCRPTAFLAELAIGWLSGACIQIFLTGLMLRVGFPLFQRIGEILTPTIGANQAFAPVQTPMIDAGQVFLATAISAIFVTIAVAIPTAAALYGGRGIVGAFRGSTVTRPISTAVGVVRGALLR